MRAAQAGLWLRRRLAAPQPQAKPRGLSPGTGAPTMGTGGQLVRLSASPLVRRHFMYDYVIVGAGSAGCVLANRLSADPSVSVALIEAGGSDRKQEIQIPAAFSKLFKTPYDWDFETRPQKFLADRELYWPRGKMLGGSSSINAMMWVRGHQADYDGWAVPGWGWSDVLPYFHRIEHRIGTNYGNTYGTDGP